jgi:hypothetical protein
MIYRIWCMYMYIQHVLYKNGLVKATTRSRFLHFPVHDWASPPLKEYRLRLASNFALIAMTVACIYRGKKVLQEPLGNVKIFLETTKSDRTHIVYKWLLGNTCIIYNQLSDTGSGNTLLIVKASLNNRLIWFFYKSLIIFYRSTESSRNNNSSQRFPKCYCWYRQSMG